MYASNLSPQMFKDYVNELLEKDFIFNNEKDGRKFYSLTEKGFNFLEKYKEVVKFVEDFGL